MTITEDMVRIRAKQLAIKYEDKEGAWAKYTPMAYDQLKQELGR